MTSSFGHPAEALAIVKFSAKISQKHRDCRRFSGALVMQNEPCSCAGGDSWVAIAKIDGALVTGLVTPHPRVHGDQVAFAAEACDLHGILINNEEFNHAP
jgi:hypothetical protein